MTKTVLNCEHLEIGICLEFSAWNLGFNKMEAGWLRNSS
jgi:hypothetical protein